MAKSLHFWTDEETEYMLGQLKEMNILKYMDGRKTRNGVLFRKVADQLEDAGFKRTPEQIRVRWKHLKQAYYSAKKKGDTDDNGPANCPYFNTMEDLLGSRPRPEPAEDGVDIGFTPPVSAAAPKITLSGRRRRQGSDLEQLFQRMQQMQNTWMEYIQQSQEREERLVNSILQSNASVVSALVETIHSLRPSPDTSQMPNQEDNMRYGEPLAEDIKQEVID
ncbi:uncharacterized protein LOC112149189 [Oryzias melastigma]|uniref:uncharacterized protein LOC112149189 n=1 Tax=Oryzias melastigma TaxID=30732 RepID=UPI000CF7E0CF|nr:uncharacterized protein LOC112149189 [Oryzias melastigma]